MKKRNVMLLCVLAFVMAFSTVGAKGETKTAGSGRAAITLTAVNATSIKVSWPNQKRFANYEVYRKAAAGKSYQKVAVVKGTAYTDRKLKKNTLYKYKVRPFRYIKGKKSYGRYSYERTAAAGIHVGDYGLELSLPEKDRIGVGIDVVTTDRSTNKKTALIYRSTSAKGPYQKVGELTFNKSGQSGDSANGKYFADQKVSGDTTYFYKIKIRKSINKKTYFSGFSQPKAVRTQPKWTMDKLTYSNLADEKTREEMGKLLKKAGIRESYISELTALIKDYGDAVGRQPYFHQGFATIDGRSVDYEAVDTYSLWTEKRSYADVNCRLTAMTLFRDFITTESVLKEAPFLATDTDAMEHYPLCRIQGPDRDKFYTVYDPAPVGNTTNPEDILQAVQKAWRNRGVRFKEGEASLVSVVCHDEIDNLAFVGHAGVMVQDGGSVYFIEKFGPTSPYQAAKFQSKEEVREYLLNRFWKFYTPGVSAPPVIMENDRELTGPADRAVGA